MKIRNEIECQCAVRATLSSDGEKFSAKMTATAVYDDATGATATATVEIPQEQAEVIYDAMIHALKACAPLVHAKVFDALSTSRKMAQTLGEIKS